MRNGPLVKNNHVVDCFVSDRRKMVFRKRMFMTLLLAITFLGSSCSVFNFGEARLSSTSCKLPIQKQTRCLYWERSFQEAYSVQAIWGMPHKSMCNNLLKGKKTTVQAKGYCSWQVSQLWQKKQCSEYGIGPEYHCYICSQRLSAEKNLHRLQAYAPDCYTGTLIETVNIPLKGSLNYLKRIESGEKRE